MAESGVGMASPYRLCSSIALSVISVKKSAFQYHCRPFGSTRVECALEDPVRHRLQSDHERRAELTHRSQHIVALIEGP